MLDDNQHSVRSTNGNTFPSISLGRRTLYCIFFFIAIISIFATIITVLSLSLKCNISVLEKEIEIWKGARKIRNEDQSKTVETARAQVSEEVPVPLHRYYNSQIPDHVYYSYWTKEYDRRLKEWGYVYEGTVGKVFRNPVTGTVPLYHFFMPPHRHHFYTTNPEEVKAGDAVNNEDDGIEGYVYPSPTNGTVPLYRYYNPKGKNHYYTTNWTELRVEKNGYTFEHIQCYVLK